MGLLAIVAGFALEACAGADSAAPGGPVRRVTVTVGQDTLTPRRSIEVGAVLPDAQGRRLTGRVVRWSSSAPGVVSVDSNLGVAQARSDGRATIIVASEGVPGWATAPSPPRLYRWRWQASTASGGWVQGRVTSVPRP